MDLEEIFTEEDIALNNAREEKFLKKKRKALLKSEERRRKNELREINEQNRHHNIKLEYMRRRRTTTKILMYLIFFNCLAIEIYSMYVMYALMDLSALYSLIGAVIGESIAYGIYCCKSFVSKREEKRNELERELNAVCDTEEEDIEEPSDGDIPEGVIMEEG